MRSYLAEFVYIARAAAVVETAPFRHEYTESPGPHHSAAPVQPEFGSEDRKLTLLLLSFYWRGLSGLGFKAFSEKV